MKYSVDEAIFELTRRIESFISIQQLGEFIEDEIRKIIPNAHISIVLLELGQSDYPEYPVYRSKVKNLGKNSFVEVSSRPRSYSVYISNHSLSKIIMEDKEILYINDLKNSEKLHPEVINYVRSLGINSCMFCPFISGNQVFGYLGLWKPNYEPLNLKFKQQQFLKKYAKEISHLIRTFVLLINQYKEGIDYYHLINHAKDIIFSLSNDGKIIGVNDVVDDILEYKPKELISKTLNQFIIGVSNHLNFEEIKDINSTKTLPFRCKSGKLKYLELVFWLKDLENEITVHGIGRDATTKIEDNARIQKLNRMLTNSINIIFIINSEFKIEYVNRINGRIFGKEIPELIGKDLRKIMILDDNPINNGKSLEDIISILQSAENWEGDISVECADRSPSYFKIHLSKNDIIQNTFESTSVTDYLLILEDITTRKLLEKEMTNSYRLKSLGLIAGGIAHDFNNQLAALMGNVGVIKLIGEDNQDANLIDLANTMETLIDRSVSITNQ
ncbi:MAG: PAS domain S-box protein, partial [Candidatus Heimdallarchaeota archaeon]|nr:PAS domain S-box protein [Candidatus Heimdallarchaeota archaeon]